MIDSALFAPSVLSLADGGVPGKVIRNHFTVDKN